MKKISLCLYLMILILPFLSGQQLPLLQQQIEHRNPAFLPANFQKYDYTTQASLGYNYQWVGLEGAPRTISGDFTNWDDDYSLLYGGNILHDETGPTQFTSVSGKIGYGIQLTREWFLTGAINGGLVHYRIEGDQLNFLDPGDFTEVGSSKIYPDISLGSMLYFKDKYYVGFSIPQLFGLNLGFDGQNGDYNIHRDRHYYGVAGVRFDLLMDSWLDISSEVQYLPQVPVLFNVNLVHDYRGIYWITTSYSTANRMRLGGGIFHDIGINRLSFGYVFSNYFQSYGPSFGSSHELQIAYSWN
jgi:type IX secretion system PorP/SprF family membrane protein